MLAHHSHSCTGIETELEGGWRTERFVNVLVKSTEEVEDYNFAASEVDIGEADEMKRVVEVIVERGIHSHAYQSCLCKTVELTAGFSGRERRNDVRTAKAVKPHTGGLLPYIEVTAQVVETGLGIGSAFGGEYHFVCCEDGLACGSLETALTFTAVLTQIIRRGDIGQLAQSVDVEFTGCQEILRYCDNSEVVAVEDTGYFAGGRVECLGYSLGRAGVLGDNYHSNEKIFF